MTGRWFKSDLKLTTYTPYPALTGELWGVYYDLKENWPRANGTALYIQLQPCHRRGRRCPRMVLGRHYDDGRISYNFFDDSNWVKYFEFVSAGHTTLFKMVDEISQNIAAPRVLIPQ